MSTGLTGSCLCGKVTYDTGSDPLWITICYCKYCQRATGSDRMIEPVFERHHFNFTAASPAVFTQPSDGSGKDIHAHFCSDCGTKLALTFERWPDKIGIYIGTLDDPSRISVKPENSKHIFVSEAPSGTLLPPNVKIYQRHAAENDGTPIEPTVYSKPVIK
ncbi:GFA family protein [Sulfitobacter sp. G21635-S1]|uniref:GFA family protein n=1 Tax=Sulfitobacter sp. G21635-S1 TaxID=3014043 RepID=UPI0022AE8523|nr:GFA family protein [Sulfitobacter sp. G21635-S1]MCZ4255484.1 GFA family protein [Sulfitobacter sp. G21635-S1]